MTTNNDETWPLPKKHDVEPTSVRTALMEYDVEPTSVQTALMEYDVEPTSVQTALTTNSDQTWPWPDKHDVEPTSVQTALTTNSDQTWPWPDKHDVEPTSVQTALMEWDKRGSMATIKHLIADNLALSNLQPGPSHRVPVYSDFDEFDAEKRQELRQLLYVGGADKTEVTSVLNFEREALYEDTKQNGRSFDTFCLTQTLQSKCRRVIRQAVGAGVTTQIKQLHLPSMVQSFILLKDILPDDYFNKTKDDDGVCAMEE